MLITQRIVKNSKKPRKYLTYCIQTPGLGSKETSDGKIVISRQGKLIPTPIEVNIANITTFDSVNAAVIAVPTNGAEQGVARTVAKKPLKKSLVNLF